MEPKELSSALLQPQDTVVAILGELLATLPRENETLPVSAASLYRDVMKFTRELRATLCRTDAAWQRHNVTVDGDNPVTCLSRALAAYKSSPETNWKWVTWAASEWQWSVAGPVNSWAELARKATELRDTCRGVTTEVANTAATATARARELQDKAARDGTAQENMVGLGQALGREEGAKVVARYEAQVRREAMVAASEATRATMVRQRVEAALGLLERLVAACDEATVFPRELQRRVGDIKAALEETYEEFEDVPEDLVPKVAEAEQLWEANARLAKDHLVRTLPDIIQIYFTGDPTSLSACGVAQWCQRASEDIPRLLRPPEHPQSVPRVSPELSSALLQPQVTVVAILGELLLATLPRRDEMKVLLIKSPRCLYRGLENFTEELYGTLYDIDDPWWHRNGTYGVDLPMSLSRALAAYKSTPWTTWGHVRMAASEWQEFVNCDVDSWAELARKATELRNACRVTVTEVTHKVATATARARELQDEAARDGTAQENMVKLGQALGGEEGAKVVAGREAQERREARVAAREARRATMVRQRVEAALGLLERLVAACDEATAFPRELQRRVGDIVAALEETDEESQDVPEDLVAKVAEAEQLWEANFHLGTSHLERTLDDIISFCFCGDPTTACEVAEQCRRASEDIPRLLQVPECPQSISKISPVSMELQELSLALLKPQVTVVATLGKLLATLPRWDEEMLPVSAASLYWDLVNFTESLWVTLYCTDGTWWRRNVTYDDGDPLTSLSGALAAYDATTWTTEDDVTMAARKWQRSVSVLVNSWAQLARKATKLRDICREVATEAANREATATARARELQDEAAHDGTAQENVVGLGQALGREEGAEVGDGHEAQERREARVAASEATRATMVRQRVEAAQGLLEHLVAACDEATALPRELQRRVGDIKAGLQWKNEEYFDISEDLVAKVAEAERLWEANARLAKDHLLGTVPDTIEFWFTGGCASPSACGVAERCQRATKDIPRLLQTPESPQSVSEVSPMSLELQGVSPPQLLEALVAMVTALGEVAATVTGPHRGVRRCVPPKELHVALRNFTWSLRRALERPRDTSTGKPSVPSLGQALATLGATPGKTWADVRAEGRNWRALVAAREERWKQLKEEITKLRDACQDAALAWARYQQDKATRRGTAGDSLAATAQPLMVARDRDEEASAGAARGAQVVAATNEAMGEAMVATRRARTATRKRHWAEVALEPLQRLVDACDKGTEFVSHMGCQLRDIEAALEGTNDASLNVPEDLVAMVAKFEQLWEASTRLFKHHLLGTLGNIHDLLLSPYNGHGGPSGRSSCAVTEQCQRAIEDIPRLLQDSDITAAMSCGSDIIGDMAAVTCALPVQYLR